MVSDSRCSSKLYPVVRKVVSYPASERLSILLEKSGGGKRIERGCSQGSGFQVIGNYMDRSFFFKIFLPANVKIKIIWNN